MRILILLIALVAFPVQVMAAIEHDYTVDDIWVATPYPALQVAAEEPIQLTVNVHNKSDRPRRVDLSVDRLPKGWTSVFKGDGKPVSAVFVGPDSSADLKLHLTPPENVKGGTYTFEIGSRIGGNDRALPIQITLGDKAPPKIAIEPEFPDLRGASGSEFTFKVSLRNDGGDDALIGLEAIAPPGFQTTFNKEYGSQQITSMPVKTGASENIEVKVKPSQGVKANTYKVKIRARTDKAEALSDLTLTVTGQPELTLTGTEERISGRAHAGEETPLKLVISNIGTAPANNVELTSTEPSGWKVKFDHNRIPRIGPGEQRTVTAMITPSRQAVAGDYMVSLKAKGDSVSKDVEFRITVATSTVWGSLGIAAIVLAIGILALAMFRFGRR